MLLTLDLLKVAVASWLDATKLANPTYTPSYENTADLVDKIAKVKNIPQAYTDKLPELNGENLPLGKTIEEYFANLILPTAYDETGAGALSPSDLTYTRPTYSYPLARKKIKVTRHYNDLEKAFNSEDEYISAIADISKSLADSQGQYKYALKRQLIGRLIEKAIAAQTSSTVFATATAYVKGAYLKESAASDVRGVVVRAIAASNADDWATCVANGYIVILNLVTTIAIPTDEVSGEAFIKQVKKDIEVASDTSEGHSLNGNTLGSGADGMMLYVKQGVIPSLEVDTLAGAFHTDQLAVPAVMKPLRDFGDDATSFAVLVDPRGLRLCEDYLAVRTQENADGDFINFFEHSQYTGFMSCNTFFKVYKIA